MEQVSKQGFIRRNTHPLIFVAFGALVLIASLAWAAIKNNTVSGPLDFGVASLDGGTLRLSDYRGKVVAVNFWASWCVPCREEMPALATYARQHQEDNFVLLSINVGENEAAARGFIQQYGDAFPVGLDSDDVLADRLGIAGLPVTLILDRGGRIVYRHVGAIPVDVLDAKVNEARR
jgi:cytochrome c biogenesis protein CcmG, thiol:disulfide interchange protein DsbE